MYLGCLSLVPRQHCATLNDKSEILSFILTLETILNKTSPDVSMVQMLMGLGTSNADKKVRKTLMTTRNELQTLSLINITRPCLETHTICGITYVAASWNDDKLVWTWRSDAWTRGYLGAGSSLVLATAAPLRITLRSLIRR